ncbi:hypothetical protein KY289_031408 [Solanum tuberosum]|nr:hypothetical protein KY289_031408 [Solanum tuberosum]
MIRRYEGPFEIIAKAGKISFRVDMPHHLKIHPVFYANVKDRDRGQTQIFITPPAVDKQIEAIINHQLVRNKGWNNSSSQFLVHWKGTTSEEATWEKYEDLWQFRDKFHSYLQVCGAGVIAKSGGGACITPQGATLNFGSFEGEANSCCASAGLKRRVDYFLPFGGDLETLDEHVGALTCSQKWGPTEGTRLT